MLLPSKSHGKYHLYIGKRKDGKEGPWSGVHGEWLGVIISISRIRL